MKIALIILIVVILGAVVFFFTRTRDETLPFASNNNEVNWSFDGESWQASSTPPLCPEPLVFASPVAINLASGILYPGQVRGGDYKPHGGFRFDSLTSNNVNIYAPIDGSLFRAARHLEFGEVQYSLYFMNSCGIMYKLDHLKKLTEKFENILSHIPLGAEGDSRTSEITPNVFVDKGEYIATQVGFENFEGKKNIFVDFGLYDLRKTNNIEYDATFRAKHPNINEYGKYAVCWFDYLSSEDENVVRSLPAGGSEGKVSDYCN